MDFDLQALDALDRRPRGRAARVPKFQPHSRARPRPAGGVAGTAGTAADKEDTVATDAAEPPAEVPAQQEASATAKAAPSVAPILAAPRNAAEVEEAALPCADPEQICSPSQDGPRDAAGAVPQDGPQAQPLRGRSLPSGATPRKRARAKTPGPAALVSAQPASGPFADCADDTAAPAENGSHAQHGAQILESGSLRTRPVKRRHADLPQPGGARTSGSPGAEPSSQLTGGDFKASPFGREEPAREQHAGDVPQIEPQPTPKEKQTQSKAMAEASPEANRDMLGGASDAQAASDGKATAGKKNANLALAKQDLDLGRMPLKQIIAWSYAREKARVELERHLRDEAVLAGEAPDMAAAGAAAAVARIEPAAASGALVPQVQVVDGQIVVAQRSLEVQAQPQATFRRVVEDTQVLNSNTYRNIRRPDRWTVEETNLFYKAVRQFGTDFSLMERIFPGRPRRTLKKKFNKEERADPNRLTRALKGGGRGDSAAHQYRELVHVLRAGEEGHESQGATKATDPMSLASMLLEGIDEVGDTLEGVGQARAAVAAPPRTKRKYTFHTRRPRSGWTHEQLQERQRAAQERQEAAAREAEVSPDPKVDDAATPVAMANGADVETSQQPVKALATRRRGRPPGSRGRRGAADVSPHQQEVGAAAGTREASPPASDSVATLEQAIYRPVRLRSQTRASLAALAMESQNPGLLAPSDSVRQPDASGRTRMEQLADVAGMS